MGRALSLTVGVTALGISANCCFRRTWAHTWVSDDYAAYWDLEAFAPYRERHCLTADMLVSYFARQDPAVDWEDRFRSECLGAAYDIVSTHAEEMFDSCREYPAGQHQFFELYRFDFIFDARLKAHLMEVNMSPNLSAIARPPLDDLFTCLVRDVFRLVGISGGAECCRRKSQDPDFAADWEMANSEHWLPLHREFAGREPVTRREPAPSRQDLPSQGAGRPCGTRFRFSLYGALVECELSSSKELDALSIRLPPGVALDPDGSADVVYRVDPDFHLFRDGALRLRASSMEEALEALLADLYYQIAWHARTALFVHARAVVLNGRAILLPGPRHSGASTIAGALVEAGATYYSDQYVLLDASGCVHPYFRPDLPAKQCMLNPAPVELIVSTRYEPGATWAPHRVSAAQALLVLLKNTVRPCESADLPATIQILTPAATNSRAFASDRGEASEAIRDILSMHASGGADAAS